MWPVLTTSFDAHSVFKLLFPTSHPYAQTSAGTRGLASGRDEPFPRPFPTSRRVTKNARQRQQRALEERGRGRRSSAASSASTSLRRLVFLLPGLVGGPTRTGGREAKASFSGPNLSASGSAAAATLRRGRFAGSRASFSPPPRSCYCSFPRSPRQRREASP